MCVDTGPLGSVVKSLITQRLEVFFLRYGPITCSELIGVRPVFVVIVVRVAVASAFDPTADARPCRGRDGGRAGDGTAGPAIGSIRVPRLVSSATSRLCASPLSTCRRLVDTAPRRAEYPRTA